MKNARIIVSILDVILAGICAYMFRETGNMLYAFAIFGCAVSMTCALYDI